jgi:hypothetical protein
VFESFLEELSKLKSASPIVALTAKKSRTIYAFKKSEIQKLNINWGIVDVNDYLASATLLSCKTFDEVSRQPFEFKCPNNLIYKAENIHNFYKVVTNFIDRFDEIKSKLPPKIYKIAYEELCKQIENYYLCAIYLCKKGKMSSQEIVDFDNELEAKMPFVYFSVEKNMKFDNLKKIRQSGFAKIGFTTSIKLNWYINNN